MGSARKLGYGGMVLAIAGSCGCVGMDVSEFTNAFRIVPQRIERGTPMVVKLSQTLSSRTAFVGMAWTGIVAQDVRDARRVTIPAGSAVLGSVIGVSSRNSGRPALDLAVRSLTVDGRRTELIARSDPGDLDGPARPSAAAGTGGSAEEAAYVSTQGGPRPGTVLRAGSRVRFTVARPVEVR